MLVSFQPLFNMDVVKPKTGSRILTLTIYNRHLDFNHDTICFLAIVDKENEKAIQKTSKERRKHLEALNSTNMSCLNYSPLTWHKHGSMCAAQAKWFFDCNHHVLELHFFTYTNNTVNLMVSESFDYYLSGQSEYKPLFDQVKIDQKGGIFCHRFGKNDDITLWGKNYHILEYSCSKDQKSYMRRCAITIKGTAKDYALSYLIPFPALFKAILQAPIAQKNHHYKFYDLSNALIPDNYQEVGKDWLYLRSFEKDLPKKLRDAIIRRYNGQHQ